MTRIDYKIDFTEWFRGHVLLLELLRLAVVDIQWDKFEMSFAITTLLIGLLSIVEKVVSRT